ncbi:DUF6959 family protein [Phenylobacterium sp.]|uniref:DUF6959 family protein n=1 Tax=Phenylobacterium sp. TaxID=1871053 RepID=UPI003D2E6FC3
MLSEATNFAVVQLPGRAYPGVVFQGDSLASLIGDIAEAAGEPDQEERCSVVGDPGASTKRASPL